VSFVPCAASFDMEIEKLNSNILAQDAFRYLKEYENLQTI
jgi:hypothetical protein